MEDVEDEHVPLGRAPLGRLVILEIPAVHS